jgi:hypothetical protein
MSNEKEKTALDYYSKKIVKLMMYAITGSVTGNQFSMLEIKLFQESKEMEKKQSQQYAEFCVMCDRENLPLLDFESYILKYGGNK